MTTEARVIANRRNAEKSTGPRTKQGKAIAAQNALKHGLLARQEVVLGEEPQEFELLRAQRVQNETFDYLLARELKNSLSDLPMELSAAEEEGMRENPQTDPRLAVGRMVWRDYRDGGVLDRLMLYERRIESSLYRTMKELETLRLVRKQGIASESEPISDSVKQSQSPAAAGGPETVGDCAKQSQPAADGGHDEARGPDKPACETKPMAPAGADCTEQSQSPAEEQPRGQHVTP